MNETRGTRKAEAVAVRPGQVWADNDRREKGRTVRVDSVDGRFAYCTVLTARDNALNPRVGHSTRIAVNRMRPTATGFRLIGDVSEEVSR